MPFFSKVFKGSSSSASGAKESAARRVAKENGTPKVEPPKPRWEDAWTRASVEPEEVQELLHACTHDIKARALDLPFLILPFRPASDPSAAKTFIRNFFGDGRDPDSRPTGERLLQELRLVEPLVLCSVVKWCWSRLLGGVVTWEAYELFSIGEKDSQQARDAFNTFIPMSVSSKARERIIFDFFDLLAAMAAHGKTNGLGGRKLSRLAGWWAFEHTDTSNGFESGYKSWTKAADATSHLFFAYLRSLAPNPSQERSGVSLLPRALESLLNSTPYPPVASPQLQSPTSKVIMIVENVSPTPFALLQRAKNFNYRDEDHVLQRFSDFDDPAEALTDECRRVLKSISSANTTSSAKTSTSLKDPSWSRFEDIGFSSLQEESDENEPSDAPTVALPSGLQRGVRSAPQSKVDLGRPTTPSWADFLSTGFADEKQSASAVLLPPDKILPPLNMRGHSSQSQRRMTDDTSSLEPGELANITHFDLDDAFWWAWITSLSGEEPPLRRAAFGRCALVETKLFGGAWLVMEERIKGAAPEPDVGVYVAEKKSRFTFSKKLSRSKSSAKGANMPKGTNLSKSDMTSQYQAPSQQPSKTSIAPDQQARIQAAAAALQERNRRDEQPNDASRRGRVGESSHQKTQSVATLQPTIVKEAAPALRWANSYDKNTIRAQYLGNEFAGRGGAVDLQEILGAGNLAARPAQSPAPGDEPKGEDQALHNKSVGAQSSAAPRPDTLQKDSEQPPPPPAKLEEKKGEINPQAAILGPVVVGGVQAAHESKALPAEPTQPAPEAKPAPPAKGKKEKSVAATAIPAPTKQQKPKQAVEEQKATPPRQKSKPVAEQRAPASTSAQQVEEQKAVGALPIETKREDTKPEATSVARTEEEPLPLQNATSNRSADPEQPPTTPDHSAQGSVTGDSPAGPGSSPESSRNRLRKKNQTFGKGIKTVFGLKKAEEEKPVPQKQLSTQPSHSSSVAAARAALEAKAKENQNNSPGTTNKVTTKKYSTSSAGPIEEPIAAKNVSASVARPEPRSETKPQPRELTAVGAAADERPVSEVSEIDPIDEAHARAAFSSFDQGAMEPNTSAPPQVPPKVSALASERADGHVAGDAAAGFAAVGAAAAPALGGDHHAPAESNAVNLNPTQPEHAAEKALAPPPAEAHPEDTPVAGESAVDAGDYWAQIRKNAVERAARMSEEQSASRTERTDDEGETTDGEETIESRVARIKARVAELTGNMDTSGQKA